MTDEILSDRNIEYFVGEWNLIPSSGGRFEVTLNGDVIFSKKALGRHAEPGEIRDLIWNKLQPLIPEGFNFPDDD